MSETIIVAIITACATTIPQIIHTVISNKQTLKIKKIEYFEIAKKNAIINFITAVGNCTDNGPGLTTGQSKEYYKALNTLTVYFPHLNKDNIDKLTQAIYESDNAIQESLSPIISELAKLLSEME